MLRGGFWPGGLVTVSELDCLLVLPARGSARTVSMLVVGGGRAAEGWGDGLRFNFAAKPSQSTDFKTLFSLSSSSDLDLPPSVELSLLLLLLFFKLD